jgi:uncharacterized repeat protein (TIGR01451 family)
VAGAANLPALDALGASIALESGQVVARLNLSDARAAAMRRDLAAYNATICVPPAGCLADRLQYVVRFMSDNEIYHLSMDFTPNSTVRFFGGRLDGNDKLISAGNPTAVFGAGYHTDFAASGTVSGNQITIRAPLSAFGLSSGTSLYSVTAFTMAGPSEATELTIDHIMRTIDATPPFDATLVANEADLSVTKSDSPDPAKSGAALTYTIVVRNNGPLAATGVSVIDNLPKGAGFSSVTTTSGTCTAKPAKSQVTCSLGSVASGASVTIVIKVKPTNPGSITNSVTVSSTSPPDPISANNTATATTTVTP